MRSRPQLARILAADPYAGRDRATIMLFDREPTASRRRTFAELDLKPPGPKLGKREMYYVHPLLPQGKRTPIDAEKVLGVRGTFRASRVVATLHDRLGT